MDSPFLFFIDSLSSRGAVIYKRYDGHYGLITPATLRSDDTSSTSQAADARTHRAASF